MSFLRAVTGEIRSHLQTRTTNAQLREARKAFEVTNHARIQEIRRDLQQWSALLEPLNPAAQAEFLRHMKPPVPVEATVELLVLEDLQGRMVWQERWYFPSEALSLCSERSGICGMLDATQEAQPINEVEELLDVQLATQDGHQLCMTIPLPDLWEASATPKPIRPWWATPRTMSTEAARYAHQWRQQLPGPNYKGLMEMGLAIEAQGQPIRYHTEGQWRERQPKPPERQWRVCVTGVMDETEVLAYLTLIARKANFPVADPDDKVMHGWIRRVMWAAFDGWHLRESAHLTLIQELVGQVYEALDQRFQEPVDAGTLRQHIAETARGLAKQKFRAERQPGSELPDPKGHRAAKARDTSPHGYTPQEVADLYGIARNTVYDWLKKRPEAATTNRPRRLSGSELEAFEQELDQKRQRKAVHDQLRKKGLTESATFKQIERWHDEGLTWQEMAERARSRRSKTRQRKRPSRGDLPRSAANSRQVRTGTSRTSRANAALRTLLAPEERRATVMAFVKHVLAEEAAEHQARGASLPEQFTLKVRSPIFGTLIVDGVWAPEIQDHVITVTDLGETRHQP